MYKKAEKISHKRFYRKLRTDGLKTGFFDTVNTASKSIGIHKVNRWLLNSERIEAYSIDQRKLISENIINIEDYESSYNHTPELPFIAKVSEGYALPNYGILTDNQGSIINTILSSRELGNNIVVDRLSRLMIKNPYLYSTILNSKLPEQKFTQLNTIAPLFPTHINYYHWLIKTLPKVRYIQHFENVTGEKVMYLLPSETPSWMVETLDLLSIPDDKIILPVDEIFKIKNMILPSWVAHSRDDYYWLKRSMLDGNQPSKIGAENVLISRTDAIDRRMTNEDEVVDLLRKYGFKKYVLSDISVEESINLFNKANIIVGAHGAGLSDIIFSNHASVVEMYGSRYVNVYKKICDSLGLKYVKFQCEPYYTDISVDVDNLEELICEINE